MTSVLATLALRFATHPENLATEALLHVLQQSSAARQAFSALLRDFAPELSAGGFTFRSQAADAEQTIPDLVALDSEGCERAYVENKFWAGLTDAQPTAYLRRGTGTTAPVLFIAPALRLATLWPELLARCARDGLGIREDRLDGDRRRAIVGHGQVLAAVSWRYVVQHMLQAAHADGDVAAGADLVQLSGLCDVMDSTAFLPLQSEELTGNTGTRVVQFCDLVDDVVAALLRERIASKDRLRATGSKGWYGHYFRLHGFGCLLAFSAPRWSQLGITPIWLRVVGPEWDPDPAVAAALIAGLPSTSRALNSDDGLLVPVVLDPGKDRDDLLRQAVRLVAEVATVLSTLPTAGATSNAQPPELVDQSTLTP